MGTQKKLGIWMDHQTANLIDLETQEIAHTILSDFDYDSKIEALQRSENIMHNKQQQLHESFYKEIGAEILKYDHVLLFGPTNAKSELHNYLKDESKYKDIKFDIESADNISDNQKVALVKGHFKK